MIDRRPNIWKLQANKDSAGLIQALTYSDPDIRKRAAAALRVLGATEAVSALKEVLKTERQPDVREHLTATLEHLDASFSESVSKDRDRDDLVRILLSGAEPSTIIESAAKLGDLGDQLATEALVMIFRDQLQPDEVRLAAARALLKLKSAPSVVTLLAGLRKDNWRIRHNAAAVLGQLRATWATDALIESLNDEHPNVRLAAAAALHRFQTKRALQALAMYQKRRSGQTKPLPRRPEVYQRPPRAATTGTGLPTPPLKSPTSNPPTPNTSGPDAKASEPMSPSAPLRELRRGKRETQQIKPKLPITPQRAPDKKNDKPS